MTTEPTDAPTPPTPPTFNGVPTPPAAAGAPTPGVPSAPPAQPVPPQKRGPRFVRIIAGVAVAIVVILLKVGAIAGVVHLFSPNHHKAKDAETVVHEFFSTDSESIGLADLASGRTLTGVFDGSCKALTAGSVGTFKYQIESSSKQSDASADVVVKTDNGHKMAVHLVDTGGWKIDSIRCE